MRQRGFTLLEVLVTVAVLAVLAVAIRQGLQVGMLASMRSERMERIAGEGREARQVLTALLEGARPEFAGEDADRRVAFAGEAARMALLTSLPRPLGVPVPVAARVEQEKGGLAVAWRLDLPGVDGALPEQVRVLGACTLDIAYWGAVPGGASGWQAAWSGRERLPGLVRVACPPLIDPPLVVALRASATSGCLYDPSDAQCRRVP